MASTKTEHKLDSKSLGMKRVEKKMERKSKGG